MRVIIAGSRVITDGRVVEAAVRESGFVPSTVLSGAAPGVDLLGEAWAAEHDVPVERYPAEWDRYGKKRAGKVRNQKMAERAEALIAIWNGTSPGTFDMIEKASALGLRVHIYMPK